MVVFSELNTYRNASENSKAETPGAAYLSKIEIFIEDHYVRKELFFEFCLDSCNKQSDASSTLCSWCTNNRWVGPVTERIPQPVPDKQNPGHFMDVYETPTTGRAPDDYQPRKCLKDLYEQNAISDLDEESTVCMPVLTFVPDDQIAEVSVQANTG